MERTRTRSRTWLLCLAGLLTVLVAATTQSAGAAEGRPFSNPIKSQKGADPWIEFYNGNYYMITTSWTDVLTMRKSSTLAGLAKAPSVQVWKDADTSRGCNFWAPELHSFNGKWYLYYVGGRCTADYIGTQRSHVLESEGADPMGPYHYKNKLKPTNSDPWLIDPSVLEVGGKLYMLGSGDAAPVTGTQNLTIAPMSNPYTVSGARQPLPADAELGASGRVDSP